MMSPADAKRVHKHSSQHKIVVQCSPECGCFYCKTIFKPSEITRWTDDGQTAICPKCDIDSVIPGNAVFITEKLLKDMNDYWFSEGVQSTGDHNP